MNLLEAPKENNVPPSRLKKHLPVRESIATSEHFNRFTKNQEFEKHLFIHFVNYWIAH